MDHDRCGSGARWCARADAMFNSDGMHVLDVQRGHRKLVMTHAGLVAAVGAFIVITLSLAIATLARGGDRHTLFRYGPAIAVAFFAAAIS